MTPGNTPAAGWYAGPVPEPTRRCQGTGRTVACRRSVCRQSPGTAAAHFDALAFFNEWRYHSMKGLLLDPSPFGTPRWRPYTSYDPITPVTPESLLQRRVQPMDLMANEVLATPGAKTPFIEQLLAYPLAFATLRVGQAPVRLTVETNREAAPTSLPPGKSASQCLERTWFVTLKSEQPAHIDLQFDYLQESSTRHELGSAVENENRLALWRYDGITWQQTGATINPVGGRVKLTTIDAPPTDFGSPLEVFKQALAHEEHGDGVDQRHLRAGDGREGLPDAGDAAVVCRGAGRGGGHGRHARGAVEMIGDHPGSLLVMDRQLAARGGAPAGGGGGGGSAH